jgi:hypothetical protein
MSLLQTNFAELSPELYRAINTCKLTNLQYLVAHFDGKILKGRQKIFSEGDKSKPPNSKFRRLGTAASKGVL